MISFRFPSFWFLGLFRYCLFCIHIGRQSDHKNYISEMCRSASDCSVWCSCVFHINHVKQIVWLLSFRQLIYAMETLQVLCKALLSSWYPLPSTHLIPLQLGSPPFDNSFYSWFESQKWRVLAFLVTKVQVFGLKPSIIPICFNFDMDGGFTVNSFLTKVIINSLGLKERKVND